MPPKGGNKSNRKLPVVPKKEEVVEEVKSEPVVVEKNDPDAWIKNIPNFTRGDEEMHRKLSAERRERSRKKHEQLCSLELEGIFNFSFDLYENKLTGKYSDTEKYKRIIKEKFRNGEFIPNPEESEMDMEFHTPLAPMHGLEIENYLHISSESIFSDLANFYGIEYNENLLTDPNPFMNEQLATLQKNMQTFVTPYKTRHAEFPYTICVTGPQYGGKTTICQILEKAFDIHIIKVVGANIEGKKKKGEAEEEQKPQEYDIPNTTVIHYTDEKTIINEIIDAIKATGRERGFVISGFPITKGQFSALEKGLQAIAPQNDETDKSSKKKSKNIPPTIIGLIIALHTPATFLPRKVDEKTGAIFTDGFIEPDFMNLEGCAPLNFGEGRENLRNRLIDYPVPEDYVSNAKAASGYLSLEGALKKSTHVCVVGTMTNEEELVNSLDNFFESFMNERPIHAVVSPQELILPAHSYSAIHAWKACLEISGRTIADQGALVNTLTTKLDQLTADAIDRFSIFICRPDERSNTIKKFADKKNQRESIYKEIWNQSIEVRDHNISIVDDIIEYAGLIELVLELKKAPKIVFIALVNKIMYARWLRNTFKNAIEENEALLPPIDLFASQFQSPEPPNINFQTGKIRKILKAVSIIFKSHAEIMNTPYDASTLRSGETSRPSTGKKRVSKEERKHLAEIKGIDYLLEVMPSIEEKTDGTISFDMDSFCRAIGITPIKMSTNFNQTLKYAEEFFEKINILFDDKIFNEDVNAALSAFRRFVIVSKKKEVVMVNAIFNLKDTMEELAQLKCQLEMERFSKAYIEGGDLSTFKYATDCVSNNIREFAELMNSIPSSATIQDMASIDNILKIAEICGIRKITHLNLVKLMNIAREVIKDEKELDKFKLCTMISETGECIDVCRYLETFAANQTQNDQIVETFNKGLMSK